MIRLAQQADCWRLAELHVASWKDAYEGILPKTYLDSLSVEKRSQDWETLLGSGESKVLLHFDGGHLVGFGALCPSRDDDGEESGEVSALYYAKSAWGTGLAAELMELIQKELKNDGFSRITLWVLRENARAQAFYRKFAFVADGTKRKLERDSVTIEEIRMVRS